MDSTFLSHERTNIEHLAADLLMIRNQENIIEIINSLPYLTAILNENREIICCNESALKTSDNATLEQILGKRPGDALNCIHAKDEAGGCGTSRSCGLCGATSSIIKAQMQGVKSEDECRITTKGEGGDTVSLDFRITSTPVILGGKKFLLFSAMDISHEKRRRLLEHIFLHDMKNKAGSLIGFIDLLKTEKDTETINEYISLIGIFSQELVKEIDSQRMIMNAENNDLLLHIAPVDTLEILTRTAGQINLHPVAINKSIRIDKEAVSLIIHTDPSLLGRVLTNMLKNAYEASSIGDEILAGCKEHNSSVIFWIKNTSVIPEEIRLQIFQRSFSTKGPGRGIGTYSMKLLGEKYLGGRVSFETSENSGTIFTFELPLHRDFNTVTNETL
jgi:hypothetical protein